MAAPLLVGEAHGCILERPGGTHCSAGLHETGLVLPKGPIAQSVNTPRLFSSVLCGRSTHAQPPDALLCLAASKGLRQQQQQAFDSDGCARPHLTDQPPCPACNAAARGRDHLADAPNTAEHSKLLHCRIRTTQVQQHYVTSATARDITGTQ